MPCGTFEDCQFWITRHSDDCGISTCKSYYKSGIGIVRTENKYCSGAKKAVYELTSYQGTGDGYIPFADGMLRRYDALDLTDGFVGAVEYTYVQDQDGQIAVFEDQIGIREIPAPITQYSSIQGEVIEYRLWGESKVDESCLRCDINNFHLLTHFLGRHIKLPDGTVEPVTYDHLFNVHISLMYCGMTASHGWEWFNPVRSEERFKEYVKRAGAILTFVTILAKSK